MRSAEEVKRAIREKTRPKTVWIEPDDDTPYCDKCKKEGVQTDDDEPEWYCPQCQEILNEYKIIDPANKRILIAHYGDGKGPNDDYPLGEGGYWVDEDSPKSSTYYPESERYG